MKKFRRIGAAFVAFTFLLCSLMVGVIADGPLPQTNTTLDFVNNYSNAVSKAVDSQGVLQAYQTGLIGGQTPDSYVVYKVEKNSPIVANFLLFATVTTGRPVFYASPDGSAWSELIMQTDRPIQAQGTYSYYTDGIGAENKYVKIVLSNISLSFAYQVDLRSISYNVSTEPNLPLIDTSLDFVNQYSESIAKAHEKYEVFQYDNGLLGNKLPDSYVVYKVKENSPVIAQFKWQPTGSEKPLFYTSSDGSSWTALAMSIQQIESQRRQYYSNGIGEGNKYVKIVLSDTSGEVWRYDLEKLSYNKEVVSLMDTKLNFVSNYTDAVGKAYKCRSDIIHVYNGGLGGNETPETYVIYKVEKNSPIEAKFKLFTYHTSGRPEFYASSNAKTWNKLDMQAVKDGDYTTYSISGIGAENKYIKIIISNVALSAAWHVDLQSLSYKASTEAEEFPETDTTLDFIQNGKNDLNRVFRNWNFAISPADGYKNAAFATKEKNNYIVVNTADDSPFKMNVRVHDSVLGGKVTLQVSNDPNNADSWINLDVTRVEPQKLGFNTWSYYATGIGEGYTYVKISFSVSSAWAFCINDISYNAGEHIGPDTSGYVEPDPDAWIPKTDTELNFTNQLSASLSKAYMFSPDLIQIYNGGIGGSNTPESYLIYKVDKNSPIVATFKIFPLDTNGRPQFFASPDGKTWEPLAMTLDNEIKGTATYRFVSQGIGKDNSYIKIVVSDTKLTTPYFCDLQKLAYNADTAPSPYDLNLSFSSDALALARVYKITPSEAFEHLVGTGLILTVDYLSGQKQVEKPRMTIAIKEGSGLLIEFKVSVYAKALDMFPKLYASKDGEKWDELNNYEMFSTGSTSSYTSYRIMFEKIDSGYEFISFEYPQTKDYAGMDIVELDDYIPDCLNSGIILTKISFMRSEKYIGLAQDETKDDEEIKDNESDIKTEDVESDTTTSEDKTDTEIPDDEFDIEIEEVESDTEASEDEIDTEISEDEFDIETEDVESDTEADEDKHKTNTEAEKNSKTPSKEGKNYVGLYIALAATIIFAGIVFAVVIFLLKKKGGKI